MKLFFTTCILLSFTLNVWAQQFQGPAKGSISSGVVVSTDNFTRTSALTAPQERGARNMVKNLLAEKVLQKSPNASMETDNYIKDPSVSDIPAVINPTAVLLKSFNGIGETNSIPPDPYIAVGPNHMMAVVNSRFGIWDKEGNLLKQIDAAVWYRTVYSAASPFDCKVIYDHFDNRWVMVWLEQSDSPKLSYFYISVSDDSNPLGTWYNYAIPSNTNGNTVVNNWADYQGVGYDKNALYLTSNQFTFLVNDSYSFDYAKIRILNKSQLYSNTAGQVEWNDFWDIKYPNYPDQKIFNIRPSIQYDDVSDYFLLHAPVSSQGINFMTMFNITEPLTTPNLEAATVNVNTYYGAPNGNQLEGGSMLLEIGSSYLRNEPKVRNGYMWAVHSVRNAESASSTSVRYVKVDLTTLSTVEDVAMGAPNYWYSYPAIEVDKDMNVAITYSRSGMTEYAGAYYTYRAAGDPSGLRGSFELQSGKGNYVKDYGSQRNRWGDYNGIWLDPSDNYSFWMFTEYASAINSWGTWIGKVRIAPFTGVYPWVSATSIDFGNVQLNTPSDTIEIVLSNYGESDFILQNITEASGDFKLVTDLSYPFTLNTYDSLRAKFVYTPTDTRAVSVQFTIASNEGTTNVNLKGYGYEMHPASQNTLYASSGLLNSGLSLTLNKESGAGSILGPSKFTEIRAITIQPGTGIIYGVNSDEDIVRINAEKGDSYVIIPTQLKELFAVAFDTTGALYAAQKTGEIYRVDLGTKTLSQISTSKILISDLAFNPASNQLWASIYHTFGAGKDRIYKIDLATGDTTRVGIAGVGTVIPALAFTPDGSLYGISGTTNQLNNLIRIDTTTGVATVVGSTGFKNVTGLAYLLNQNFPVNVKENTPVPASFNLSQNYPNPFNPSTVIRYSLPEASSVKVSIYNLLGETIELLLNGDQSAGQHRLEWNTSGSSISSGVYFYEVKAKGKSGKEYSSIKKMVLMK